MLAQMTLAFDKKNFEKRPNIPGNSTRVLFFGLVALKSISEFKSNSLNALL